MKKLLGILALTLSVSALTVAENAKEQDFLKSINWNTEYRADYKDKTDGIGNEFFKGENKGSTTLRNTLSGTLDLKDVFGLTADFSVLSKTDTKTRKSAGWETDLNLRKAIKLGNLETDFTVLEWKRWENLGSETNVFIVGPKFNLNILGQNVGFATQAVYFDGDKNSIADDVWETDYYVANAKGYGANIVFGGSGNLYDGKFGTISHDTWFKHLWRTAKGYSNSWKLVYSTSIKYETPKFFGGFYAGTEIFDEWSRHTGAGYRAGDAKKKYTNEFNIIPYVGYKTSISTSLGDISINPYIKYRVLQRETTDNGKSDNKRVTSETDRFTAGVSVGLTLN